MSLTKILLGGAVSTLCLMGQSAPEPSRGSQPLYRITITSRTIKAVNYGHRTAPTSLEFRGTPLLQDSRGHAEIETKRGAVHVNAHFSNMAPPTRFGAQYQAYVVWAISPDGRAQNLGELQLDASDKAHLDTSTSLQAFALIVTAEPYYSVTQPSDAVVMENVLAPGTVGQSEEMNISYELLPRKEFVYDASAPQATGGRMVSRDEYDQMVAVYQAQNAIQIAESQGAARYAPDRIARARQLMDQARGYPKSLSKDAVALARQATQIAEDARTIAMKRSAEEPLPAASLSARTTPPAEQDLAPASLPRTTASEADRLARESDRLHQQEQQAREEADRLRAQTPPPPAPEPAPVAPPAPQETVAPATPRDPIDVDSRQFYRDDPVARETRRRLVAALNPVFPTRDSPRGILITIPGVMGEGGSLDPVMARIAAALAPYPDLHLNVEAHTYLSGATAVDATERTAANIRRSLMAAGIAANRILAQGFGNTRPLASNATEGGREQNRRVEIIIAGDSIGSLPGWDRTYRVTPVR